MVRAPRASSLACRNLSRTSHKSVLSLAIQWSSSHPKSEMPSQSINILCKIQHVLKRELIELSLLNSMVFLKIRNRFFKIPNKSSTSFRHDPIMYVYVGAYVNTNTTRVHMHKMGYIQRVASLFTPPDGLIGPVVLVPSNGCPPLVVATVTEKPCTYICRGIT